MESVGILAAGPVELHFAARAFGAGVREVDIPVTAVNYFSLAIVLLSLPAAPGFQTSPFPGAEFYGLRP